MGRFIDETGNKYGRLLVISRAFPEGKTGGWWNCRCDCGNEVVVLGTLLRNGNTKSCGCLQKDFAKTTVINEIGNRYGFLTVISRAETPKGKKTAYWNCLCDCGNSTIVEGTKLRSGHTRSCGECGCFSSPTKKDEIGNRYGKLVVISEAGRDKDGKILWNCLCDCGNEKIALGKSLRAGLVLSCGCLHSKGEEKIALSLKELNIQNYRQHTFEGCRNPKTNYLLYFDFYLPNQNLVIEYQGEQHYLYSPRGHFDKTSLDNLRERDEIKRKFCKENNIKLIEIPYYDFDKIDKGYIKEVIYNEGSRN